MKVLILNSDYTIMHVCDIEKAICLLYIKNKAIQIDFYKDTKIRSGKASYPIPAVIILKKYVRHNHFRKKKFSRSTVLKRDNYCCMYCGVKKSGSELTLDHIIAKSKFKNGDNPTYYENVVTACKPCNAKKADKSCVDANMFPARKPYTPKYYDIILADVKKVPEEWKPYIPQR